MVPWPDPLWRVVHDLNNRLAVIAGNCELITNHAGSDPECIRRAELILEEVRRMSATINGHESFPRQGGTASSNFILHK